MREVPLQLCVTTRWNTTLSSNVNLPPCNQLQRLMWRKFGHVPRGFPRSQKHSNSAEWCLAHKKMPTPWDHQRQRPTGQGYLAHNQQPPPRTLQEDYTQGPTVVLGGGGGSYRRGDPVECAETGGGWWSAMRRTRCLPSPRPPSPGVAPCQTHPQ